MSLQHGVSESSKLEVTDNLVQEKDEWGQRSNIPCVKLHLLVPYLNSDQDLPQAMVGTNSNKAFHGLASSERSFLQIHPWKHQRDLDHAKGSHGQTFGFIQQHISFLNFSLMFTAGPIYMVAQTLVT
ncbi:hypothetical protein PanWU01x14_009790 [Parasponia andersonii]|uniref:Uncharacterized protein n=1 Tax=Parasponia andersonii TaxID=3476 RepID=A0A2P5E2K7_PARAD|nr:hypothetical protein PanWU01x14_009790 [Parasponia andersonii]